MIREFFDSLDLAAIHALAGRRQEEHLSLEFKTATPDLSSGGDKKNFAEMLSGFANSAGGVIVWGVSTEKDANLGADVATAATPIPNVARFKSRLAELTFQVVSPDIPGVLHRYFADPAGAGFATSLVPESSVGPHMALAGHHRYFKRAGDRFYRMEHFDIADMFGRRQRPELSILFDLEDGGHDGNTKHVRVPLQLRNSGRAAAVAPFVYFQVLDGQTRIEHRGLSQHARSTDGLMRTVAITHDVLGFVGLRDLVIPPGPAVDVGIVKLSFERGWVPRDRTIRCQFGAENAPLQDVPLTIASDSLSRMVGDWR